MAIERRGPGQGSTAQQIIVEEVNRNDDAVTVTIVDDFDQVDQNFINISATSEDGQRQFLNGDAIDSGTTDIPVTIPTWADALEIVIDHEELEFVDGQLQAVDLGATEIVAEVGQPAQESIEIVGCSLSPVEIPASGGRVTLSATVRNSGSAPTEVPVEFHVEEQVPSNDTLLASQTVSIAAGGEVQVTAETATIRSSISFLVRAAGNEASCGQVIVGEGTSTVVVGDCNITKTGIGPDETTTLTVSVSNTTDNAQDVTIAVFVDGDQSQTIQGAIPAGQAKTLSTELGPFPPGSRNNISIRRV